MITILMNWLKLGGYIVIEVRLCKKWIHRYEAKTEKAKMKLATISFCFALFGWEWLVTPYFILAMAKFMTFIEHIVYWFTFSCFLLSINTQISPATEFFRYIFNERKMVAVRSTGSFFLSLACLSSFLYKFEGRFCTWRFTFSSVLCYRYR